MFTFPIVHQQLVTFLNERILYHIPL